MNVRPWTVDDVARLVKFVRSNGGDVKLPARLLNNGGVEVIITHPLPGEDGFAQKMLTAFEKQR